MDRDEYFEEEYRNKEQDLRLKEMELEEQMYFHEFKNEGNFFGRQKFTKKY